jgi:TRAP-type uncharacterized transport system fused permease subunit
MSSLFAPGTDNKALHELRDELKDLNLTLKKTSKASEQLTSVLVVVAVLQIVIALFQLVTPFFTNADPREMWKGVVVEVLLLLAFIFVLRKFGFKNITKTICSDTSKQKDTKH